MSIFYVQSHIKLVGNFSNKHVFCQKMQTHQNQNFLGKCEFSTNFPFQKLFSKSFWNYQNDPFKIKTSVFCLETFISKCKLIVVKYIKNKKSQKSNQNISFDLNQNLFWNVSSWKLRFNYVFFPNWDGKSFWNLQKFVELFPA